MAKLTKKRKDFADAYLQNNGNIYKAAIAAGYSKNYAKSQAHKLLENVGVLAYINQKLGPIEKKRNFDIEQAIEKLIDVIEGEPVKNRNRHLDNLKNKVTKDVTYEYAADFDQRIKAIELYLKYKGAFIEKQEIDVRSVTFVDDVPVTDDD